MSKSLEDLQKKYSKYIPGGQNTGTTYRNDFLSTQFRGQEYVQPQTRNVYTPSVNAVGASKSDDLYALQNKYSQYFVNKQDDTSRRLALDLLMSGKSSTPVVNPADTEPVVPVEPRKETAADKVFNFIYDAFKSNQKNPSLGIGQKTVAPDQMYSALRSGKGTGAQREYDSGYSALRNQPGFLRDSSYVSTEKQGGSSKVNPATGRFNTDDLFEDVMYDYINGNEKARDLVDANAVTSGMAFTGDDKSYLKEMDPEEVAVYNYLYKAAGKDQANEYIENIKPMLLARSRGTESEAWKKMAEEKPVSSSLFSIAVSPLKSVSYVGQIGDLIENGEIDQNAGYNRFVRIPGSIREKVGEEAKKKWGNLGSFGYQTTMSMGDFLYNALISGSFSGGAVPEKTAEWLTLSIMGTGAAADTVVQKKDMGYDDTSAFVLGTVAGAAEIVTEKVSLETLLKPDLTKGSLKYIWKNMVAEGSEEGASDLINWYADHLYDVVSGRNESEWKRAIREYEAQGYNESQAFGKALADRVEELGTDVLGGMISGGVMAGVGVAGMESNYVHIGNIIKSEGQGSVQSVIDKAKTLSGNERASRLANEVDVRAGSDNWRNVSSRTLGELAYQVASRNAAQEEAQNEYNETPAEETAKKAVSTALSTIEDNTLEQERTTQEQNKSTVAQTEETTVIRNESPRTMEEEQVEMVRRFSKTYPGEAAQTFMAESYESGQGNPNAEQDPDRFAKGWHAYYMAGMNDEAITEVNSEYQLTQSQKDAAYKAGTIDAMRGDFYGEENNADRSGQRGEDPRTAAARKRGRRILERRSQTEQRRVSQEKSAAEARNLSETSEAVSSRSLGIANGTDTANIRIIPSMRYNDRMVQIDNRNRANGVKTVFLTGPIEIREGKGNSTARGVYSSDGSTIYIRADHSQLSIEQINDHENFHRIKRSNPEVMERCRYNILNHYSEKMLDDLVDAYVDAYAWTNMSADDILEEIYADAYAGIDIFDYMDSYEGATRFSETVKGSVKEANVQESGEDARTGEQKYSDDTTSIAFDRSAHTAEENRLFDEYLNSVDERLLSYLKECLENTKKAKNDEKVSDISSALKTLLYQLTGFDYTGYTIHLNKSAILHIKNDHIQGAHISDRSMENLEDLARIGYVLSNPDACDYSRDKKGNIIFNEFRNADGTHSKNVTITKKLDGTYYSAVAVPVSGKKQLWIKTAYINNKIEGISQVSNTVNTALDGTSETEVGLIPSKNNIAPAANSVNQNSQKSSMDIEGQMTWADLEKFYAEKYNNVPKKNTRLAAKETRGLIERIQRFQKNASEARKNGDVSGNARTVALGITSEFVKAGYIDFGGLKLDSDPGKAAGQIAAYAMILRNPNFETFRILYTKGNQIVGNTAVTSYNVDAAYATLNKDAETSNKMVRDQMKRLGADGYYLMHNHPSGDVSFSNADRRMTAYYRNNIQGLRGHIIIDHNTYGYFDGGPALEFSKHEIKNGKAADYNSRVIDSPLLYSVITGPDGLADIAKNVVHSNDVSTVIYASKNGIRGIQEVDNKFLLSKDFRNYVKNRKLDFGSSQVFLVSNMKTFNAVDKANLYQTGVFTDVVAFGDEDDVFGRNFYSMNSLGRQKWSVNEDAGLHRVYESGNNSSENGNDVQKLSSATKFSRDITVNMSEEKRYDILKDARVYTATDKHSAEYSDVIETLEQVENRAKSKATEVIFRLTKNLKLNEKVLTNPELDVEFIYSNKGIKESINKQQRYGGTYAEFAKALLNLDDILLNAQVIEKHTDKYTGTVRENPDLKDVSVLFGAFEDGDTIVPVQFEVKDLMDKGGRLYMTVTLSKIEKADVMGKGPNNRHPNLVSASAYSIQDIIEKINTLDKDFLKYIPDQMLSDEQKAAKQDAIAEEKKRIASYPKAKNSSVKMSNDIDSEGNQLTEQQAEYFKESKIRDDKGNLMPVFHGTNADFNIFDTNISGGKNGTAEGFGIYLTDDPEVSSKYGDRIIKAYANIKRPATSWQKTIKSGELEKLIRSTCEAQAREMVDEDGYDSVKDAIKDTWVSNYVYTYEYANMNQAYKEVARQILRMNDDDMNIVQEVMSGMAIRSYNAAMDFYHNHLTPVTGIDGFWTKWSHSDGSEASNVMLAFDSNQTKYVDNKAPTSSSDLRFSMDPSYMNLAADPEKNDAEQYSYKALTSKPNMPVVDIKDENLDRDTTVSEAYKNARLYGRTADDGSTRVLVDDTGKEVIVGRKGILHGLGRKRVNYAATVKLGELLKNSVRLNEYYPKRSGSDGAYLLASAARDENGNPVIVTFVINKYTRNLEQVDTFYSLNARQKENQLGSSPRNLAADAGVSTGSEITIADLLSEVKDLFPDVLSMDVLNHFGITERPDGELGNYAKYSKDPLSVERGLREQNELLKKELAALKNELKQQKAQNEKLRGEFQLTEGPAVDRKSVEKVARRFAKDYQTKVDTKEISETIGKLAEKMLGNDVDIDAVKKDAIPLARKIAENAQELVDNGQDYQLFKELMQQKRGIKVSPGVYADFPDGFNTFRKRNFGKINFKNDGVPIADVYREAQDMFGTTIFPDDVMNEADMAQLFEETLNDMRPVYENPYSYNMAEATEGIANDIVLAAMDETIKLKAPTFADRQKAELEKAIAAGREETRKAIERERSRRDEYVKEIRDRYAEYRKNMRDARARTEVRGKISRGVERISKLLISPTDKRHIPPELQKPVARLLEAINLDNGKNRVQETKRSAALKELQEMYRAFAGDFVLDPDMLGDEFHDGLLDEMMALEGKSIYAMDLKELDTIWRGVTAIEASIRSANRLFQEGKYSTVSEIADKIREDNLGKDTKNFKLAQVQKLLSIDMLTPEAFMHRLGDTGDMLFKEMRGAQDKAIRIYEEAKIFSENELKGVDYQALEKEMHTVKLGGREAKMSTAQIMELYNLSKRAQALTHLIDRGGGISLKEQTRQKGVFAASNAETYRNLTMPQLNEIIGLLTPEQLRIAEAMQVFVSTVMAGHGNEAAMQVYGYEKFGDPHYWPIKTNDQDLRRDAGKTQGIITSVAGVGMAQPLTRKANNSIAIRSVFDTFSNHITEMANYAAWLPVMEDINRVRNYTFRDEEHVRTGTMRETFDRVYGRGGAKYLEKLMGDLANGVQSEQQFFGGLMGKFKATAVGANLRVIIQQPTAIFRAADMLGPQYLAAGAAKSYAKGWTTAKKYSAIATWKDWGFFDIHTGRQMKDILFENSSKLSWLQEKAMAGAGWADSVGWGWLWNSCYAEQKALNKGKNLTEEQLNELTAKRFDDIIDHTQVVDGILQRSQLMRTGDGLTKMATSFMGEPTKQYNMFVTALYDMQQNGTKASKKRFARALTVLLASGAINAVAQSIMDAVRDDDRDRKYWEKFAAKFTGLTGDEETAGQYIKGFFMESNLGDSVNPMTYIPYVKDVWSIIQGYDVERMDVSVISDMVTTVSNLVKALNGGGNRTVPDALINAFAEAGKLFGLPATNLKRDILGIANTVMNEFETPRLQYELDKFMYRMNSSKKKQFLEDCYQAYKQEKESFNYIYNDLIEKDLIGTSSTSSQKTIDKYIMGRLDEDFGEDHEPYVRPEMKKDYQGNLKSIKSSAAYKKAKEEDRTKAEADLLELYQKAENKEPAKTWDMIEEGSKYGITAADVILYELAFSVVDQPNKNGNYGTATNEEREAALQLLGVSGKKADYMWSNIAKGSESGNPYK